DLGNAIVLENLDLVRSIIGNNPWLITDCCPNSGDTWLQSVCRTRNITLMKQMLELGYSPSPIPGKGGGYPLDIAVDLKDREMVDLLLEHGADPNVKRAMVGAINLQPEEDAYTYVKLLVEHGCDL